MWSFIHSITVVDSVDHETTERQHVACVDQLRALADAIPCHRCAATYRERCDRLSDLPVENMALFRWGWEHHNAVNAKLGKTEIGYEGAIALWAYEV